LFHILGVFFLIISFNSISFANEYGHQAFVEDLSSPVHYQQSRDILIYGSLLTSGLILLRNDLVEPFQESMVEQDLLGDYSRYGDLAGQMIPNLIYMGYMGLDGHYSEQEESARRAKLMFKVSAFSGITTFFLKRLINERRPNKGDRNSFPSGHSTTAFAFASVIAIEHPGWKYAAYGLASFVAFSRINDNAHYLHDVVMGATIGTSFGYALAQKSKEDTDKVSDINYSISPLVGGQYIGLNYSFD
jgi:hypothetical protein